MGFRKKLGNWVVGQVGGREREVEGGLKGQNLISKEWAFDGQFGGRCY